MVVAITKVNTDLERIGDESDKIAHLTIELETLGRAPRGYSEISQIGELVVHMLHDALDAFARLDVELALEVIQADKRVDQVYGSALRALVTHMMEDPTSISQIMNVIWALRALERVGDHAGNISEYLIYLVKGEDIRHMGII